MTMLLPGMPASYGMPMGGMYGQPVYIQSLSQLPPGAIPVSQGMLAQALGQSGVGSQMVQEERPSTISSILKGAGIGAAAGAAFGAIPFLPLGLFSGAIVGAVVGAAIGAVKGLKSKKDNQPHTMTRDMEVARAQAQMAASTPVGARSAATEAPTTQALAPIRKKAVMSPAMRRRWAARVRAERAEAAALSTPPIPEAKPHGKPKAKAAKPHAAAVKPK